MSFDRQRTPPRSSYNDHDSAVPNPLKILEQSNYIPHIFDLVTPSREASKLTHKHIPTVFLEAEAVDSSVLLGHGASFSASLQRVPDGPKTIDITTCMPEFTATQQTPAPPRPNFVVYKVARVAFDENGEPVPQSRRALQSVLTEYHALIYPPLFEHENIIDFLGIAWGSNPFSSAHKLPAIVVEYAEHGTLAALLNRESDLELNTKQTLCLDVARGLAALHNAGLVHGDVKAENILLCSHQDRKYVAKVADFGFSVVEETESAEVWISGTDPWKAPETKGPISVKALSRTDVFSFGLLIWLVCIDGANPFDLIIPQDLQGIARATEIEVLKQNNSLPAAAKTEHWLYRFQYEKFKSKSDGLRQNFMKGMPNVQDNVKKGLFTRLEAMSEEIFNKLYSDFHRAAFICKLDEIFGNALQSKANERDLAIIITLLEPNNVIPGSIATQTTQSIDRHQSAKPRVKYSDINHSRESNIFDVDPNPTSTTVPKEPKDADPQTPVSSMHEASVPKVDTTRTPVSSLIEGDKKIHDRPDLPSWVKKGYKHRWISWQEMRDLEPSVQNFVFDAFPGSDGSQLFVLCAFFMNGYGTEPNTSEALLKLKQAANMGHHISRAYMYRLFSACKLSFEGEVPGAEYLYDYATIGSRTAFEDLRTTAPIEKIEYARHFLREACAGTGAPWFNKSEMLQGYTQSQWIKDDFLLEQVEKTDDPLHLSINRRGDSVLHFAAACGRYRPFRTLIVDYKMDINLLNPLGETPLLCACRSGQGGIAIVCLQDFRADASIAALNGESPLHWLISFSDQDIEPIVRDLLVNGASIAASTTRRVAHSEFPATIDVDFQTPGTPLSWAVHHDRPHIVQVLLKHGANPNWYHKDTNMSPLLWAAYFHHHQCLRIMIEHLEHGHVGSDSKQKTDSRFVVIYGPIIWSAVHAADKFSMILRNGADYITKLHCTLDLLRERTQLVNFELSYGGSMIYCAVSGAHDEVVDYMFQHDWCLHNLNEPCDAARRTPVLEAVRWNRRSLFQNLVDHGADIHALAANPFQSSQLNWSALHIFAHEGHNKDVSLVRKLVESNVPVDGFTSALPKSPPTEEQDRTDTNIVSLSISDRVSAILSCETPFAVAIRHNAFHLASELLSLNADPNALTLSAGLFTSPYPLTILGHVIISNARYSSARLKYLLNLKENSVNFIVEPARQLSALHRAALSFQDVSKVAGGEVGVAEFDMETSSDVIYELLLRWRMGEELNAKCGIRDRTALHLAIEVGNLGAVDELVEAGADREVEDDGGETAVQLAERLAGGSETRGKIFRRLR